MTVIGIYLRFSRFKPKDFSVRLIFLNSNQAPDRVKSSRVEIRTKPVLTERVIKIYQSEI